MAPKPKRTKPSKTVVAQTVASPTKKAPNEPAAVRAKHEKLVRALRKLHPMD